MTCVQYVNVTVIFVLMYLLAQHDWTAEASSRMYLTPDEAFQNRDLGDYETPQND